ncbi:MAG: hypothetical protein ACE14V_04545 [bacterium]
MKNPNPSYIQVNKDFDEVLDKLAAVLYSKVQNQPVSTQSEFHRLVYESINQVLFPAELDKSKLVYLEPKLQFAKSGPVGTASYAAPIERQDYGRRKPRKPYQVTPARQIQQTRMQIASSAWKSADADIRSQWEQAAGKEPTLGTSLYCGVYMALLADNKPIPNPFIPTPEILEYYHSR